MNTPDFGLEVLLVGGSGLTVTILWERGSRDRCSDRSWRVCGQDIGVHIG